MCTLDPLGYAYSQYVAVPFLVLHRALEQHLENPSEAHQRVLDLVGDTCTKMILHNHSLKQELLEKAIAFVAAPANRTVDVVPALPVLLMQLLSWSRLPDEQKLAASQDPQAAAEQKQLSQQDYRKLGRYAVEEAARRMIKKGAAALDRKQILSLLMPDHEAYALQYKTDYKKSLEAKMKGGAGGDPYAQYAPLADKLRAQAAAQEQEGNEPQ